MNGISMGEWWLRRKIDSHSPKTFHQVDSQLLYAAVKDLLRSVDELRDDLAIELERT